MVASKGMTARAIALAPGVPPPKCNIASRCCCLAFPAIIRFRIIRRRSGLLLARLRQDLAPVPCRRRARKVLPLVNRTAKAFSHWLSPAYQVDLELRPGLDAVEALGVMPEARGQASARRCGQGSGRRAF